MVVYKSVLKPTLLNRCQAWVWHEKHKSKGNMVGMRYLRSVSGETRMDRVGDEWELEGIQQDKVKEASHVAIMMIMACTIFTPVLLVMVKVIQGQVAVKGHCPEVTVVDNFDVSRYSGVWYEQKRLFFLIEGNGICVNATYTPQEDGTVQVLNQNYNPEQVSTRKFIHFSWLNGLRRHSRC
uniref:Lipocalin/cytosolic fatty-acid binding domain-containing protein n=1 Tax=Timema poppense TaxID=170557 RepID=A0A7R9D5T8_TIMPO|nr:unnamed protein product [Timema poppensis]